MKALALTLLFSLSLLSTSSGHIVQQLFVDFSVDENEWMAEVRFDAGIALPEMRADKLALQPKREWLIKQTPEQHAELRKEAETYLRECLQLRWINKNQQQSIHYRVHFPEWESSPPEFANPFTDLGFAYFSIQCTGSVPKNGDTLEVFIADGDHPDFAFGYSRMGSERIITSYPGKTQDLWTADATPPSAQTSFFSFLNYGYSHVIPEGWDHVLFIAALCFLSFAWRPLLSQSLIFTLGHTITLGLTIANIIPTPPPLLMAWIEILIAGTIVYVAVENFFTKQLKPHRLITIFIFGLIHGLGFASVLGETIQSSGSIAMPLIVANLGVELGQVSVIAIVLISLYWAKEKSYFPTIRKVASASIAAVGSYWMIERLIGLT